MTTYMTMIQSARAWWRKATMSVPEPSTAVFSIDRSTPRIPREYQSLYTYLEHRYASVVVLTFEQIEALLGCALPARASSEPDWWTGEPVRTGRQSDAWTGAGRTATPNLMAKTVTFERRP